MKSKSAMDEERIVSKNGLGRQDSVVVELESVEQTDNVASGALEVEEQEDVPSCDTLLEAVNNRRRRYALHYLQQHEGTGPVELSEVSRQVAAWEQGSEPEAIGYDDRKNVHTSLYQFHAPKLADFGLIDYDKRGSTLELTECGRNLQLELSVEGNRDIDRYSLALAGMAVAVFGVILFDVPLLSKVPDVGWSACLVVLFLSYVGLSWRREKARGMIVTQQPPESV